MAACATPAPLPVPSSSPAAIVSRTEAVIVFPASDPTTFPWEPAPLANPFEAVRWTFSAFQPGRSSFIALARIPSSEQPSRTGRVASLDSVPAVATLQRCTVNGWIMVCGQPLSGRIELHGNRVVLRIDDADWLRDLFLDGPDSGSISVPRSAETSERTTIAIEYVGPRARPEPGVSRPRETLTVKCPSAWMAVGESFQCRPFVRRCHVDVCTRGSYEGNHSGLRWLSSDSSVLAADRGTITARRSGNAYLTVRNGISSDSTAFRIVPPFRELRFEQRRYVVRVGDTVQVGAWTLDSAGNRITGLAPQWHSPRTGQIRPVQSPTAGWTWDLFEGIQPGVVMAYVAIGTRRDSAVVEVVAR